MSLIKNLLPELYQNILEKKFLNSSIHETKATCDNCLRSRDHRFKFTYKSDLKCCTFFPFLPNFAVGGILFKQTAKSHIVKHKISNQQFSLPLGLFPDLKYQHQFQNKKETDFGNRSDLLCPYYDTQNSNCGIWEFRGTVCTTYYCRSDYGEKGLLFWQELNDFMSYVEMALAEECLVMMDFSPRDISDQLIFLNKQNFTSKEKTQTSLKDPEYKKFWNGYTDPQQFYLNCYSLVQNLSKAQLSEIMGDQGKSLYKKLVVQKNKIV